jgi:hypothetical protein
MGVSSELTGVSSELAGVSSELNTENIFTNTTEIAYYKRALISSSCSYIKYLLHTVHYV